MSNNKLARARVQETSPDNEVVHRVTTSKLLDRVSTGNNSQPLDPFQRQGIFLRGLDVSCGLGTRLTFWDANYITGPAIETASTDVFGENADVIRQAMERNCRDRMARFMASGRYPKL